MNNKHHTNRTLLLDINSKIYTKKEKALIPVYDGGYYFGLSLYETTLVKNGIPLFLEQHLKRMQKAADFWNFPSIQNLRHSIKNRISKLVEYSNGSKDEFKLRIMISPSNVDVSGISQKNITEVLFFSMLPKLKKNYRLFISNEQKSSRNYLPHFIKPSANYKNIFSVWEARKHNCDESILTNEKGHITEGSFSNIFFIQEDTVHTPDLKNDLLNGVTREIIIDICRKEKIPIKIRKINIQEITYFQEAFLTSSIKGVRSISEIHSTSLKKNTTKKSIYHNFIMNKLTQQIAYLYRKRIEDHIRHYH